MSGTLPVAVVIVTFNSADVLAPLLDSLGAGLAGIAESEVIVVDNDSADGSADLAEMHPMVTRVIRTGRNAGYAAAINIAADTIPGEMAMLILNPDTRLTPGSIRILADRARDATIGVVVPLIHNDDGSIATSLRREPSLATTWPHVFLGPNLAARMGVGEMIADPRVYEHRHPIDWATGAILLVTPRARQRVGRWDESFFLYSEEVDFQRRVRDAGLSVLYEPAAQVMHIGGDFGRNAFLTELMTRNQIRYFARHHGSAATLFFRGALASFALLRFWRGAPDRAVLRAALLPQGPTWDRAAPTGA